MEPPGAPLEAGPAPNEDADRNRESASRLWPSGVRISPSLVARLPRSGRREASADMHSARHTAITDIVRNIGNLKAAQVFAGHASIQTTADIYAHVDLADLREALQLVAAKRAERRRDAAE